MMRGGRLARVSGAVARGAIAIALAVGHVAFVGNPATFVGDPATFVGGYQRFVVEHVRWLAGHVNRGTGGAALRADALALARATPVGLTDGRTGARYDAPVARGARIGRGHSRLAIEDTCVATSA